MSEFNEALDALERAIRNDESVPWGIRFCRDAHYHVTHGDEDLALPGDPFKTQTDAYLAMEKERAEQSPRAARQRLVALYEERSVPWDLKAVLASLLQAIPYLPDHIDGEFDSAITITRKVFERVSRAPLREEIAGMLERSRARRL